MSKREVIGSVGDRKKLLEAINIRDWNDYVIMANKGRVLLSINGVTMCELEDRDPKRLVHGWLAAQVHAGPPMLVQLKDVFLRRS